MLEEQQESKVEHKPTFQELFTEAIDKSFDLTEKMDSLVSIASTTPTTIEHLEKIINLAATRGSLNMNLPSGNLGTLEKFLATAKNYISDTDSFFV